MGKVFIILAVLLSVANEITAQCPTPLIEQIGKIVASRKFEVTRSEFQHEFVLQIESATENSSWAVKEAEAAVLTIFVDGKYNQDVMLFAGAEKFVYKVLLGKLAFGKHEIKIALNEKRSAKNAHRVKIFTIELGPGKGKSATDILAIAHSPVISARPDTIDKFSDIPLITYYEIISADENSSKIRYTTIFTNEDGGTRTAALMARWGRSTDIEWVYEIEIKNGEITSEIYQGANHETKSFAGEKILGDHPLLFNATVNNNFADAGCSDLRFLPVPIRADLSAKSRETLMDENSWTYRLMAEEASREGRINSAKFDIDTIADPRDYLYVEVYSETKNAAFNIEAQFSETEKYSSDAGIETLRVSRPGYVRIAVRFPATRPTEFPKIINVGCYQLSGKSKSEGACYNVRIINLVRLDKNYSPVFKKITKTAQNIIIGKQESFSY